MWRQSWLIILTAAQTSPLLEAKIGMEIKKCNAVSGEICPSIVFSSPEIHKACIKHETVDLGKVFLK